ncbi:NAD(P)-binding protein [Setomelanomma holmii]|uniref:NAD(P)-binding protein n=1 Tax=Setomelanomma holmii TaxID=210430 RepID=A0A9P4H7J6_9PLEO|nr:NAD(P)-binding protein [Setomelanomma holmii]
MITRALALNGARRVYIVGRRSDILQRAAQSIDSEIVIPVQGDVTSQESLLAIATRIEDDVGYINLVVTNAGTVNATSVRYTALAFLHLLDAGNKHNPTTRSQIIATSSIGGFSCLAGASFAYSSSKAGVTHMMKMMATAFVPFRIRCNVLAPGLFPSELAGGIIGSLKPGETGGVDVSVILAERTGMEEDFAGAVLYMTSRAGGYLNGCVILVDGGRLGMLPSTY